MSALPVGRLEIDMEGPRDYPEAELIATYRDSCPNDRTMLFGVLLYWADLTPSQRSALYRVADLFASANSWRRGAK